MSKPDDLPLYLAVYKLTKYLYLLAKNFPKSYKYTLGQNILDLAWETLDSTILANRLPNKQKPEFIRQASTSFDKLKIRLRLAHEIQIISDRKQAFLVEKNEEICKMLAGWLKWAEKA